MKNSGFTFIEVMITLLVFSIISLTLWAVLSTGKHSWHRGVTQIELQQETRKAMDRITKELRQSGSTHMAISGAGTVLTFQVPVDWDNDGDIVDDDGNIEWGADDTKDWAIQYFLNNNRQLLRRTLDAYPNGNQTGADKILANNIRSDTPPPNGPNALMFTDEFPAAPLTVIGIEVSAQKPAIPGQLLQATLQSQVTLRNTVN